MMLQSVVVQGKTEPHYCMVGALVPSKTIIGAGSLVPPGKKLQSGFLYVGSPVKKVRELKAEEILWIQYVGKKHTRPY